MVVNRCSIPARPGRVLLELLEVLDVSGRLGDLLDTARRQCFVGRRLELAGFDDTLNGRSPRRVLFVHGHGGIGKTTLLLEFAAQARAVGRGVVQVDGREIDPSPHGLLTAFRPAPDHHDDLELIARLLAGAVLLIDGYEQLSPIDGWLRDDLIPRLSADTIVVLAGRDPPAAPWRTDPGWRQLVAVYRLDPFDATESGELLVHSGVAASVRPHLVTLGRGHPLTVALLADLAASGQVPGTLADAPDLIATLLELFICDAPSEAHLTGLATCVIAWLTTEDLLTQMVGAEAATVWQWLARRPFITRGPRGLLAHDLTRDVLDAELARRAPERYRTYQRTIYTHMVGSLRAATGIDRQWHAQQLLFQMRSSPFASANSALQARGPTTVVPAHPDDHDQVCSLIEHFEGPASAQLARAWLGEQPNRLSVVRTGDGIAGFAYQLLCPSGATMEDRDPVVRTVLDHIAREGPLRPGERVSIARFRAGAREHQRDPYALLAANVSHVIDLLPGPLAWSIFISVDPAHAAPFAQYTAYAPLIDIDVGGLRHVAYGIDWRRVPLDTWLDLMFERNHSGETGPPPTASLRPPPLDRAQFGAAVKKALQTLHRPDHLATNPLIDTALATTATGPTTQHLRAMLEDAIASLSNQPKGDQLRTVLDRTYLRAAPTQEAAAEVLDLPFSTYRRYLAKALDQLTDLLWTMEIGNTRLPARPRQ
jgi:hypothetical protein